MDSKLICVRRTLRFYGGLFALAGAGFVLAGGWIMWGMNLAAVRLPGGGPVPAGPTTLWLGLTGSLMAVLTVMAFALARNPGREPVWFFIILSKFTSAGLFMVFACSEGNSGFLLAAATDGLIGLHFIFLRGLSRRERHLSFAPLYPGSWGPFYEVWFAKANDPRTRSAAWVRYVFERGTEGARASCWYVLFDAPSGRIVSGRWERDASELLSGPSSPFRLGDSRLEPGRLVGAGPDASWELSWENGTAPGFIFAPPVLAGILPSGYAAPVSLGRFNGSVTAGGLKLDLKDAPGSIGHLWGPRMAESWRWAHAAFAGIDGASAFELLTARVLLGPFRSPELTTAHFWHGGRHYESVGLAAALRNASGRDGERWLFRIDFGEIVVEGECSPAPGMSVALPYRSPDGRALTCQNSKTGAMRISILRPGREAEVLSTPDQAAVEYAGPA